MRGLLSNERYEELKKLVVEMFEEAEVNSLPIDCFYIAKKLKYVLRPYSQLDLEAYLDAMDISVEGYSQVEKNPVTGMYEYVIYYNDMNFDINHQRFTIFHEIAHCYLGHHDEEQNMWNEQIEEAEANFFAKYAMAPPPLINHYREHVCPALIQQIFQTSGEEAGYDYDYYMKWLEYGPVDYTANERHLLAMFEEWFDYEEIQQATLMAPLQEDLQISLAAAL